MNTKEYAETLTVLDRGGDLWRVLLWLGVSEKDTDPKVDPPSVYMAPSTWMVLLSSRSQEEAETYLRELRSLFQSIATQTVRYALSGFLVPWQHPQLAEAARRIRERKEQQGEAPVTTEPVQHTPGDSPGCCEESLDVIVWRRATYAHGPNHEGWSIVVGQSNGMSVFARVFYCPFCGKELPK